MANKVEAQTTTKKPKQQRTELTPKEKAFCRYYVETGNGVEADTYDLIHKNGKINFTMKRK